jgi:regulator of protease activity HflC (stomatin/prohibitin superfamily)
MVEDIDESKKLSLEEVKKLKAKMNLLRKVSFFVLLPVLGYFLLLIFTPIQNFLGSWSPFLFVVSFLSWYASHAVKFIKEWENGVVLRLGRLKTFKHKGKLKDKQPGPRFIWYPIDKIKFVKMWERQIDILPQVVNTVDGPATIDIKIYYKVKNAGDFMVKVEDPVKMIVGKAMGDVTANAGSLKIEQVMTEREKIAGDITASLNEDVKAWGMEIVRVRLEEIKVPESVMKAMEHRAAATKEAEAVVAKADGEANAVKIAAEAQKQKRLREAEAEEVYIKAIGGEDVYKSLKYAEAIKNGDKIIIQDFFKGLAGIFGKGGN